MRACWQPSSLGAPEIAMNSRVSKSIRDDLTNAMESALQSVGIVNIPLIAEQVRKRNEHENVALEDVAYELLLRAQLRSAPMEFDAPLRHDAASTYPDSISVVSEK